MSSTDSMHWLWLAVAAPVLGLAAIAVMVRLRGAPVRLLPQAWRATQAVDPESLGELTPAAAMWLSTVASFGGAAVIGTATAVGLGGAGVLPWCWLFCFLVASLRFAEAALARTSAVDAATRVRPGSLGRRFAAEPGLWRYGSLLLAALAAITGLAFTGGAGGVALLTTAERVIPDGAIYLVCGAAIVALALTAAGIERTGGWLGWLAAAAVGVLFVLALWTGLSDPSRFLGALADAIDHAVNGMPPVTPHSGALAEEVMLAAVLGLLPPLAAATGIDGAFHAAARARSTKGQASAALLGPLLYAVVVTTLGLAFVATGAHYKRVEAERPLTELRIYKGNFESASQRHEPERLFSQYIRVIDGKVIDPVPHLATERAVVRDVTYRYRDQLANVALQVEDGRPMRLLVHDSGVLADVDPSELREVQIEGEMVPVGAALFVSAVESGTGTTIAGRIALGALFLLVTVAAAAWGFALRQSVTRAPGWLGRVVALLPGLGLLLTASPVVSDLPTMGLLAAGVFGTLSALFIVLRVGQVTRTAR